MRTSVQVRLSSIEQAVYEEYIQQLATPTVVSIVTAEPLPGPMVIEMGMGVAFSFMDRLLGGPGHVPPKTREVTDIELLLLRTIIKGILASLREYWLQLSPVTMKLDDLNFSPQNVQAALPGDVGVLLLFEIRFMEVSHILSMYVPYAMLEPIIDKLSAQMWFSGAHREMVADKDEIRRQIQKVKVPIMVQLGSATVTVRELLGLQEGNVIKLDTSANQEMEVIIEGKTKFLSRPGRVGRNLGFVVTRVLHDDAPARTAVRDSLLVGV
ncbi:MAG: FliM/FliN family flagellar motor switch protein [Dehalococcoidia bacterium]|nr:FliM/FliN family flagellar motor switch protein [Dehalococcoidia bacterium]